MVAKDLVRRKKDAGDVLFRQGDSAESMYLIKMGSIKLWKIAPDGRELILDIRKAGDLLGEGVLIEEAEYRQIRRIARRRGMTLAEWVRQALRAACREEPLGDRDKKLAVVREATSYEYPTADIGQMLEEIESGYGGADSG